MLLISGTLDCSALIAKPLTALFSLESLLSSFLHFRLLSLLWPLSSRLSIKPLCHPAATLILCANLSHFNRLLPSSSASPIPPSCSDPWVSLDLGSLLPHSSSYLGLLCPDFVCRCSACFPQLWVEVFSYFPILAYSPENLHIFSAWTQKHRNSNIDIWWCRDWQLSRRKILLQ